MKTAQPWASPCSAADWAGRLLLVSFLTWERDIYLRGQSQGDTQVTW